MDAILAKSRYAGIFSQLNTSRRNLKAWIGLAMKDSIRASREILEGDFAGDLLYFFDVVSDAAYR